MNQSIPSHEGRPVNSTAVKMSGAIPMDDLESAVFGIDDIVQLVAQFRVVAIHHNVDKDGNLVRVQVLRPMTMIPFAIDPDTDPDKYVLEAYPRVQGSVVTPAEGDDD